MVAETLQARLRELGDGEHADRPAVRTAAGDVTWRDHVAEARAEAAGLIDLADPARPLHVGVLLGNTPAMLRSMAAAALGGYVLVGLNTTRRGAALAADVRRADCQLLLVDDDHRHLLDGLDLDGVRVVAPGDRAWPDRSTAAHREVGPSDTFMLIFTSGTSGEPKAVQVAHGMVLVSGLNLVHRFGLTADDVCYVSMPLFHSNAVVAGWAVALGAGAAVVPARFSASGLVDDLRRFGATYLDYVGKPLAYVLATPERPDDADNPLRVAFGNEASDRDIAEFSRRFGCQVTDGFGSTELAIVVTRAPGTPPGSIGVGLQGVAIYDEATLSECDVAEFDETGALVNADRAIGQLVNVDGAGWFSGYYGDDAATDERMRHGMFWSGDLAYRDADGWIYLAGRTADWLRVDGENLAAAPIERILQRLPEVSQVAVYGVGAPDGVGDQVVAALVLVDGVSLTPSAWEEFLAAQADLPRVAWPSHVRLLPELPATATNKVLKRTLVAEGAVAGEGVLWTREPRARSYAPVG